jgi:hypothetical protein
MMDIFGTVILCVAVFAIAFFLGWEFRMRRMRADQEEAAEREREFNTKRRINNIESQSDRTCRALANLENVLEEAGIIKYDSARLTTILNPRFKKGAKK